MKRNSLSLPLIHSISSSSVNYLYICTILELRLLIAAYFGCARISNDYDRYYHVRDHGVSLVVAQFKKLKKNKCI